MLNNNLRILCVILHYGSENLTNECIQSIINNRFTNVDIVVSDNDPSQSYKLPETLDININIVKTGGNVGFAKGNNIGVNKFLTNIHDSVLILSNDTILTKNSLNFLRETLHSKIILVLLVPVYRIIVIQIKFGLVEETLIFLNSI